MRGGQTEDRQGEKEQDYEVTWKGGRKGERWVGKQVLKGGTGGKWRLEETEKEDEVEEGELVDRYRQRKGGQTETGRQLSREESKAGRDRKTEMDR